MPLASPRLRHWSFYFLPVIGLFATLFGLFYLYLGVRTLLAGIIGMGIFLCVFGIAGIAMAVALWSAWRKFPKNPPSA